MNKLNLKFGIIITLIIVSAIFRILPHLHNVTPLAAMGIFGAAYLKNRWQAFLIPFLALFCSDLYLNNVVYAGMYDTNETVWITSPWIYAAFGLLILASQTILKNVKTQNVVLASVASSLIFFIVTNLGTFIETTMYPKTAEGLVACFIAAIPFFGNTMMGDLFFCGVLFGIYEFVKIKLPKLA
jgi:hypothetical protein